MCHLVASSFAQNILDFLPFALALLGEYPIRAAALHGAPALNVAAGSISSTDEFWRSFRLRYRHDLANDCPTKRVSMFQIL